MVFNLVFSKNTISSYFIFFLFLNYWLMLLLFLEVIVQFFNPTAKFAMVSGKPAKEAKSKSETHPVTAEAEISKRSI